ncbi:MAG: PhoU domain-containing protein [Planctomycetota bacterium]|jgi:phosphate uptake regulator
MFNFKALLEAWRAEGLISQMYKEFEDMLDRSAEMFAITRETLAGEHDVDSVWQEVRRRDKEINRTQRLIRRQVVEHLTVEAGVDVPACLILMSIVKDAERLGDYMGYLFKVARICPDGAKTEGFADEIARLEEEVARMMADAKKALADSDEDLARNVMAREETIKDGCDAMLENISKAQLPSERIVAVTLISRYLRRLIGHTANIASSVVNPVERLDYKPKD